MVSKQRGRARRLGALVALASVLFLCLAGAPAWSGEPGKLFATPDEGAKAFVDAVMKGDRAAVLALLGGDAEDLVPDRTRDPAEKARVDAFLVRAKEYVGVEAEEDGTMDVIVGNDRWPMPVPLVKAEGGWRFDPELGRQEILARIIGANELGALALLKDLVASQEAYEALDRDGDGVREYAQKFLSSEGKTDGLWWDADDSPLGLEVGDFLDDVAKNPDPEQSVHGYRWKMLKAQGAKAPGGAFSYVINGNQVAGYAFVATPSAYKKTGVMTFLVGKNGKIYEKDLGEQGLDLVKAMEAYEPDETWTESTGEE